MDRQGLLPEIDSRFLPGNRVTLIVSGERYFSALESAFDRATDEIYLETYIYENDATGRRIADVLKRAVRRGVAVHLLVDGYGSRELPKGMLEQMRSDGVQALVYRPRISPWTFRRERLRRLHRKIAVVDREIAFVGGFNISDDRESSGDLPPRHDYAVAVEGPLVGPIRLSTRRLWSLVSWSRFRKGASRGGAYSGSTFAGGQMRAAFLIRDNFRHRRDIETAYIRAIEGAGSEVILAHAYFLPGQDFRRALIDAAKRGVRVILLLQGRVEYRLQHYASRALYGNFLDAGIEIYEYPKSYLHAKVAVIDGHWATVGSSNIDPFSFLLSREANVVVDDASFGMILTESLKQTIATDGCRILAENWKRQPVALRILSWCSYGLVRVMAGISGSDAESGQAGNER